MADGLKVDFAEIDRMVTGLTNLNAYALPLVPKVGALSADGDLLASAILSPGTAVAAEGAVLSASAQLGVTMVTTEALVVITASIVKVYEAAETALAASVIAMEATVGADSVQEFVFRAVVLSMDAVDTTKKITNVLSFALTEGFGGTSAEFWRRSFAGENVGDLMRQVPLMFQKHAADGLQTGLNGIPGPGYEGLLDTIIRDGSWLGWFDDRQLAMSTTEPKLPDVEVDGQTLPDSVEARAGLARGRSLKALGLGEDAIPVGPNGHILPQDLATLLAGSAQIDEIGKQDFSDIRVVKTEYAKGQYAFTVQIPSTLRWWPVTAAIGNDFTSDAIALQQERQTALASAAWDALDDAMEDAGASADSPVMLSGFSLGGITAGSMAADPHGHNVEQVVTAGAPIGRFDIPATTGVTAFEADGDPVARLDGVENSRGTIVGPPAELHGVTGLRADLLGPGDIHNANRYARMAQQSDANTSSEFEKFFNGNKEATDYYGKRE